MNGVVRNGNRRNWLILLSTLPQSNYIKKRKIWLGQQLISVRGACPKEMVQPKCDELFRVCEIITERLMKRLENLSKNRDLMERVEKVCGFSSSMKTHCAITKLHSTGERMVCSWNWTSGFSAYWKVFWVSRYRWTKFRRNSTIFSICIWISCVQS